MRWPRKNDAASVEARRAAMGVTDGLVTSVDLEPFAAAAESLVGVAVIPVSAVPLEIELGAYELGDDGAVEERGRATETVRVPLAHTEGGLTASMTRGALAAGTIRTYVLHDRITRASCFVCGDAADAIALARWVESELPSMQEWLASSDDASLSKRARLRGRQDARRRPDVPRALAVDDRRRRRAEHDDAQLLRTEHGVRDAARTGEA